ncbi:hypothetical protein MPL1_07927 [Methylophaga lonarensis MPL]|uniref:Uncharacterized protein n=1 Tax=Methylophaga lonarensis MPL TaxID=1286106 RepID=M7P089_9GAMM|nr:hypothetical protein [Methylophaga lonarensis]EMR12881.1 hypothetical protein MPL1_07927 [Methylophaga lonarensis MPL]
MMDPVSMLFSTFLTTVSTSVQNHVSDVMGVELQAHIVEYQGEQIDFQHQLWKIKPETVCSNKKNEIVSEYASCTNAAKAMFNETCQHLNKNPRNHWKYKKLNNMYCTAAVTYTPMTAEISRVSHDEAEVLEARQNCSLLTLQARQTPNADIEKRRKAACEHAQALRQE